MQFDPYTNLALRWLHLFSAIALVGGMLYQRIALLRPALGLPEGARADLEAGANRRWSKVVMLAALVLLVTGLINGISIMTSFRVAFQAGPDELRLKRPLYDILLGVKILISLVIFFLASALSGSRGWTTKFRQNAATWLKLALLLCAVEVGVADYMRSLHTGPNIENVKAALRPDAPPPSAATNAPVSPQSQGPPPGDIQLTPPDAPPK